jgi:hypothetical protein
MNISTVVEVKRPTSLDDLPGWHDGCSWLAGGTWLFAEPQVAVDTLIDLESLGWAPLTVTESGLDIAATCRIVDLHGFEGPPAWRAVPLFRQCIDSFLMSFKIWNAATIGGNVCMSLPAGAMVSLTAALEGVCTLWPRDGAPRPTLLGDVRGAASVAHVYGKPVVAAESLTSAFAPWAFAPSDLRRIIDLELVNGINRPVIHTSVHQPLDDKVPGLSLMIFGQYFNRHETWAEMARPWIEAGHLVERRTERVLPVGMMHCAWRVRSKAGPGKALQWWLEQFEHEGTRRALLERRRSDQSQRES